MSPYKTSREIVTTFLEYQVDGRELRLTVKQVSWLVEQLRRENALPQNGPMNDISVQSKLGEYFRLIIDQSGAGLLKPDHNAPAIFRRKI